MKTIHRLMCVLPLVLPWLHAGCGSDPAIGVPAALDGVKVKSLHVFAKPCALLKDGTGKCLDITEGSSWEQMTEAEPIANGATLSGATDYVTPYYDCVTYWDGTLSCFSFLGPLTTDAAQATAFYRGACYVTNAGVAACAWEAGLDDVTKAMPLEGAAAKQIDAGYDQVCVLLDSGGVRCWSIEMDGDWPASGWSGVLDAPGNPVPIASATRLALGRDHACAVVEGGQVKCWGENGQGQLGDGTLVSSKEPVTVIDKDDGGAPLTGVVELDAGSGSTCAITQDGTIHCWGENVFHDGKGAERVTDLHDAKSLAVGSSALSCAVRADDTVLCWGDIYKQRRDDSGCGFSTGAGMR